VPVATEMILIRTLFDLQLQIKRRGLRPGDPRNNFSFVCTACNQAIPPRDRKIVVHGSILSVDCFADLVDSFRAHFGFSEDHAVGPKDVERLIKPLEHELVSDLFELRSIPESLGIS